VFPVYSWTNLWFLHKLPSWVLFVELWDILGIFAYVQAFALMESTVLFLFLVVLALILPAQSFGESLVDYGSILMLIHASWILVLHVVGGEIFGWGRGKVLLLLALYLASVGVSLALVHRSSHIAKLLQMLADRLVVMLYIYVPLGTLGLVFVLLRNVFGMR
jgi:predicted membrane channel-forming protein YqfA (hemolysin III family)